ncbi:hypothetical protein [Paraburkholderia unamae]|uniref:Uncharacterized protein n=1 Tax=Paraburkholderia unamae TaxID=219649 RepID=A0ACC6RMJ0_9BURK
MLASAFLDKSRNPGAWRKHARALRRSANLLWDEFSKLLVEAAAGAKHNNAELDLEAALEALETTKLLYGLALETALKARIVEHYPSKLEVRVAMDGTGQATHAELRAVGVSISNGHNLLALAEAAELFGADFQSVLRTEDDKSVMRNICRDLAEVVLWRGRYPVPLTSAEQVRLDPKVPPQAMAHYMRDWLDKVLDALVEDRDESAMQK